MRVVVVMGQFERARDGGGIPRQRISNSDEDDDDDDSADKADEQHVRVRQGKVSVISN